MNNSKKNLWLIAAGAFLFSCTSKKATPPDEIFKKTWYAGKAELTSYTLQQARYGELRNGEAVLIFVTEDFSPDKLVKLDEPQKATDKIRVLKLNLVKNFVTGIYPYSMMLSAFTPVSALGKEKSLKVTSSVQEWCGHTFSSLKLKGNNYQWMLHSYFEKENEEEKDVDADLVEDELWNLIRINPSSLPRGRISLLPGLLWQRLSHTEMKEQEAEVVLTKADKVFSDTQAVQMYSIYYPALSRTLKIYFQSEFPHEILGWQETYPDGFREKKMLTTTAVRKKQIWLDYWNHNSNIDTLYRDSLQLFDHE